ncbi:Oligopeptide-binding protein OppA [bacterium HR39]|nr:Oligopeptide-binding protein OppA [bacterium HR39]
MTDRRGFLGGALAVAALATARGAAAQGTRVLRIGISQYPATLHPNIDAMAAKSYVLGACMRPLTEFGPDWRPRTFLATELATFENGRAKREPSPKGGEGVAVTYTIHPDATWGDGTPVSTRDVLFTWEVGRHPQSGVTAAETYRRIHRIDVHDGKTFTVHDEKLTYQYNLLNDFRLLPEHLERPVFEADPATYRNRTLYDTDPTNPGLWHGPYRIVEVETGVRIVLERNPTFYGDPPFFDRVEIRTVENTAALEAHLLSGAVDMIEGSLGLSLDQALAFERRHGDRYVVHYQPGLVYEHIDLDLRNPHLAKREVRRALLHAIDRELLVRQLFAGRQPVAHANVHPLDAVYDPDVPKYTHDPDRAASLLEAAGYRRGPEGVWVDGEGRRLSLRLSTTAGNRTRELVQQVLQGMWRQAGIEVRIDNEPPRVFFGETVTKRRFEMAMFAWISSPENVPRSTLHCEEIPSEENGWSGQNFTGYCNPEMDALIDAIETELDFEKRRALWSRLQRLYTTDLPALPLYFRAEAHIWPRWLSGVRPTGHQAPVTLEIEHWRRTDA